MKTCSTSLIIKEMQVKTTMRYHLTPVRMAIINKSTRRGCRERKSLLHHWWECRLTGAATVGSSMEILQNITNRPAFQPSDPTSGKIPEGAQNTNSEHKHPYVHCSIIYNRQYMEAAQFPSTDEWIKQL